MKPLSKDLEYWRAERPDEWTMDEFIRAAKRIENSIAIYCREELGNVVFDNDADAIEYFIRLQGDE